MGKEELEALLGRIDLWLLVFGIIVVVGVAGESVFGIRHWWNSRKLQAIQREEALRLQVKISDTLERAAKSEAEVAGAKESAAKAMDEQEKLRQENLKLAASVEAERTARLKLQKQIAWRTISDEQRKELLSSLSTLKGEKVTLKWPILDPEIENFGEQLRVLLTEAGIDVTPFTVGVYIGSVRPQPSLSFSVGNKRIQSANRLAKAFLDSGLIEGPVPFRDSADPEELSVIVGPKRQ